MSSGDPNDTKTGRPVPHPKRKYEERKRQRLKDVDSTARARMLKTLAYSVPGGVAGAIGTSLAGFGPVPGFFVGFLFVYLVTKGASEGAGAAAGKIYHPSGRSTPVKHEYSFPESLAARGRYEEAVTAYEVAVSEFPEDPEPYIRIARLNRDKLSEYEDAVFWFKRARNDSEIPSGQELLVTQELIEIYRDKLGTPTRAIPELARILDRFPEDQVAGWARGELARLKEQVRAEEEDRAG
jgi:tetratricopeptide (TPR) repeat protein